MKTASLMTAFHWECEECGHPQYLLPQRAHLTPEEQEEIFRDMKDLEPWQELPENYCGIEMVQCPDTVTCANCGERYKALDGDTE